MARERRAIYLRFLDGLSYPFTTPVSEILERYVTSFARPRRTGPPVPHVEPARLRLDFEEVEGWHRATTEAPVGLAVRRGEL